MGGGGGGVFFWWWREGGEEREKEDVFLGGGRELNGSMGTTAEVLPQFQEPTARRESTVKRENLNGESHGDSEEFRPEESEDFIYCHHIEPKVQHTCQEKNHSLFPRFVLLNETHPRRNIRCGERIEEKPKHLRQKQIQLYLTLQGKDKILHSIATLRKNSFR